MEQRVEYERISTDAMRRVFRSAKVAAIGRSEPVYIYRERSTNEPRRASRPPRGQGYWIIYPDGSLAAVQGAEVSRQGDMKDRLH